MKTVIKSMSMAVAAVAMSTFLWVAPAAAAEEGTHHAPDYAFSFEGPFGTFDRGQLQRGFLVYKEVCASCHSLNLIKFRNLGEKGGPEFTEEQVKAIAAGYEITDGPNDEGENFQRPGIPSDALPAPFPNEPAARAANNGALPPDLSLITKARAGWEYPWYSSPFMRLIKGNGGPEYVRAILTGYQSAPGGEEKEGLHYNPFFKGKWIAMPAPLSEDAVEYGDGTKATVEQMATDVAAFLHWASEPKMEQRKRTGFMVIIYLIILSVLLYLVKKAIWSRVAGH